MITEDTQVRKRTRLALLWRLIGMGVAIAVFGYIGYAIRVNRSELSEAFKAANMAWLAAHVAGVLCYFAAVPLLWSWVIKTTGAKSSLRATVASAYLPNAGKYIPGKVWAVTSRAMLLRRLGRVSRTQAATSTLLQYVFELGGAAPYLLAVAWLVGLPGFNVITIAPFVIPVVVLALFPRFALRSVGGLLKRVGRQVEFDSGERPCSIGLYSAFVAHWGVYALSGVVLCRAFGELEAVTAIAIGCAFVGAWLLGFISLLTPGGIGVREGALVVLLSPLVGHNTAVMVPLLARIAWTLGDGIAIIIGLLFVGKTTEVEGHVTPERGMGKKGAVGLE